MACVAIIGGTGLESLPDGAATGWQTAQTPFGAAMLVRMGHDCLFVSRHGPAHRLAPHRVNYRANIAALKALGIRRVLATNAVGSLRHDIRPGTYVLLDDFIDFTRRRADPAPGRAPHSESFSHTDFSVPYCPALRQAVVDTAGQAGIAMAPSGTYLCTDGPRFETPAEVRMFASWGADVVGMTGLPEAVLAREAGLCYAAVAIVTNMAAGLATGPVSHEEVIATMRTHVARVLDVLVAAGRSAGECSCCGTPGR